MCPAGIEECTVGRIPDAQCIKIQCSDILLRKTVIFAGLLNFNFWVHGQPTNIQIGAWANLSKCVDNGFDIMLVSILSIHGLL